MPRVTGLHHVTAVVGDAARHHAFYAGALGLRLVKRTVNFDDPGTYHLYFGDAEGTPGTVMTSFPWPDAPRGAPGAGMVTVTQYAVPPGSLPFWVARLPARGARLVAEETAFGEARAVFEDPDGLLIALVEVEDPRAPWVTDEIGEAHAIRGFRGVTLGLRDGAGAARILSEVFGYAEQGAEGAVTRWAIPGSPAGVVDLHVDPAMPAGRPGAGTVHHVAFDVPDMAAQADVAAAYDAIGLQHTPPIDRSYFHAVYARIPGGVLFEVATSEPGFATDESPEALGAELKLPPQHEPLRARIEAVLPPLEAA